MKALQLLRLVIAPRKGEEKEMEKLEDDALSASEDEIIKWFEARVLEISRLPGQEQPDG